MVKLGSYKFVMEALQIFMPHIDSEICIAWRVN